MTKLGRLLRRKLANLLLKERKPWEGWGRIEEEGGEMTWEHGGGCTCGLDIIGAAPSSSASASEAANTCTKGKGTVTKPGVRAEGVSYLLQQLSLLLLG